MFIPSTTLLNLSITDACPFPDTTLPTLIRSRVQARPATLLNPNYIFLFSLVRDGARHQQERLLFLC
jgi:hypothetical protein